MKSIISGAVAAIAIVACLGVNVQARSVTAIHTIAVSDTGKMAKDKMKMDKMKMSKMKKDSMKMSKKMSKMKMAKDSSGKMWVELFCLAGEGTSPVFIYLEI